MNLPHRRARSASRRPPLTRSRAATGRAATSGRGATGATARLAVLAALLPLTPLLLALAPPAVHAGTILNTLEGYDDRVRGWSGGLDGLFGAEGGNTETVDLEAGGRVQWRGERGRVRLQGSFAYEESGGVEIEREAVGHLRHNLDLSAHWATVAFGQLQHDPFQRLTRRWLLGLGLRRDVYDDGRGHVRLGATPMLEIEKIKDGGDPHARGRLSVFLHVARQLREDIRLDLVGFWQPLFSDLAATRTSATATLSIALTGAVDLRVGAAVNDNSRPPAGVARTDWETFLGLGLSFAASR